MKILIIRHIIVLQCLKIRQIGCQFRSDNLAIFTKRCRDDENIDEEELLGDEFSG